MGRITPAHAGTSGGLWGHPACKRDHPRTRGDKRALITENLGSEGSPPHTRGQVFIPHECSAFDRITPAHAGTRRLFSVWLFSIWDHPRTRGDKSCEVCICLTSRGSPPHTRGQACSVGWYEAKERITPAHAGTRMFFRVSALFCQDHPRTRGDKYPDAYKPNDWEGSPPHTRGQAIR